MTAPAAPSPALTPRYAGFWKRSHAYGYDVLLVGILSYVADWLLGSVARAQEVNLENAANADLQALIATGLLPPGTDTSTAGPALLDLITHAFSPSDLVIPLLVSALYNIYFVAGPWRATPGKRFCGIEVIHASGRGLSLLESALRHLASGLSMGPLGGLGCLSVAFTQERVALHDLLCHTRVVRVERGN